MPKMSRYHEEGLRLPQSILSRVKSIENFIEEENRDLGISSSATLRDVGDKLDALAERLGTKP